MVEHMAIQSRNAYAGRGKKGKDLEKGTDEV